MLVIMSATKKRKIDDERRIFNKDWSSKYFVIQHNQGTVCVICQTTIAVMKEYNIKRHYTTKNSTIYDAVEGQDRMNKLEEMIKALKKQQGILTHFTSHKKDPELVTKLSFKICEAIAEKGKSFSDGEFIKSCLGIFSDFVCPEKKHLIQQTSLSRFTVSRRIDQLAENIQETLKERINNCATYSLALDECTDISDTAQLAVFVRGVTDTFEITEEFLDMASMSSTTTGQDISDQVLQLMNKFELDPGKLCGLTTDGAPSMTGKRNGFTKKLLDSIGSQGVVVNHCIIHQQNLCAKVLGFADVMKDVVTCVNYIRSRGLNHRQFKAFLEGLYSDYPDVVYFSAVRWLSRVATLKRFWNLRTEIQSFMTSKQQDVGFLSNDDWLNDIAFLTDITQHLSDLNVKLQGKSQLVNKMYEHICSFEKKLKLFHSQLCRGALTHFPCLAERKEHIPDLEYSKYAENISKLCDEFGNRFNDLRKCEMEFKLFSQPFDVTPDDVPDCYQMEVIDLQSDIDLNRAYDSNDVVTFYKKHVCGKHPNLEKHAKKMISLFGSTYSCEQFFSRMKLTKCKNRSQLTNEHMTSQLRVASTSVRADIDEMCKNRQYQVSD